MTLMTAFGADSVSHFLRSPIAVNGQKQTMAKIYSVPIVFRYGNICLAMMERHGLVLSFQFGKRRAMIDNVTPDDAKKSLESVVKMEDAGWRRAMPDRWFGAGVAVFIAGMFAVYALEDPYPYIVFPIIGLPLFIATAREKSGAYGRDAPASNVNMWTVVLFITVLLIVFFGSIFIRRAYDAAWVSLVAGVLVGLVVFLTSENARRAHRARVEKAENK